MKLTSRFCAVALLIGMTLQVLEAAPLERSISPSRQFLIYGTNTRLRGSVSDVAEEVKADLLSILQQSDNWKTPIVIHLQFPEANVPEVPRAALYFSQTGAGLKLQLDLVIGADVFAPGIQRELLRATLLERIYRKQTDLAPGTVYVQPPDWLLDGLLAMAPGYDRRALAEAATSLPVEKKAVPLEEFMRQRPDHLDSPGRVLYHAWSLALVQVLLDGANGGDRLARYIDNLATASNDPVSDLKAQFPTLTSNDIEKAWALNFDKLGANQKYTLLTFAETDRQLDDVLRMEVSGKTVSLKHFLRAKVSAADKTALVRTSQNLMLLGTMANPVMRPVVSEYQQIAQLLATGKRKDLERRLTRVRSIRRELVARMSSIDDYMNWFEGTQLKTTSGVFVDYLRSADHKESGSRRRDAISVYLDALEERIHN